MIHTATEILKLSRVIVHNISLLFWFSTLIKLYLNYVGKTSTVYNKIVNYHYRNFKYSSWGIVVICKKTFSFRLIVKKVFDILCYFLNPHIIKRSKLTSGIINKDLLLIIIYYNSTFIEVIYNVKNKCWYVDCFKIIDLRFIGF